MYTTPAVNVPLTLASEPASHGHHIGAVAIAAIALGATLILLPYSALQGPLIPGFLLLSQMALLVVNALGAWVLYAQSRHGRSLCLLLAATATLFTASTMVLELASLPGVFGSGVTRLLGTGPATTAWLWTFWHVGPAVLGLSYASAVRHGRAASFKPQSTTFAIGVSVAGALLLTAASGAFSTVLLPWLPHHDGEDYRAATTSGSGPLLVLITVAALGALWWTTRAGRTVLELWIAVSLGLLVLDCVLTEAGGMPGSVGWYAGRIGALVAALVVLWAYLHEVHAAHVRAGQIAATELLRIGASLRQLQKMEAIGQLTSGIAHDFNNLLTVMSSAFDMIQRRPDDRERVIKMSDAGLQAVARGVSLTSQLLSFARCKVLRPAMVNPNAVLTGFEPIAARAITETVSLEWRLDPAVHTVLVDTVELETAVLNLIVNARDAMEINGGHIVIATRNAALGAGAMPPGARVTDQSLAATDYVVVSVADDGPGMPDGVAAQAFDPFFTTKGVGKGTGLGLSQVYEFAGSASGLAVIRVGTTGTTVELWLPRAASVPDHETAGASMRWSSPSGPLLAVNADPAGRAVVA